MPVAYLLQKHTGKKASRFASDFLAQASLQKINSCQKVSNTLQQDSRTPAIMAKTLRHGSRNFYLKREVLLILCLSRQKSNSFSEEYSGKERPNMFILTQGN